MKPNLCEIFSLDLGLIILPPVHVSGWIRLCKRLKSSSVFSVFSSEECLDFYYHLYLSYRYKECNSIQFLIINSIPLSISEFLMFRVRGWLRCSNPAGTVTLPQSKLHLIICQILFYKFSRGKLRIADPTRFVRQANISLNFINLLATSKLPSFLWTIHTRPRLSQAILHLWSREL